MGPCSAAAGAARLAWSQDQATWVAALATLLAFAACFAAAEPAAAPVAAAAAAAAAVVEVLLLAALSPGMMAPRAWAVPALHDPFVQQAAFALQPAALASWNQSEVQLDHAHTPHHPCAVLHLAPSYHWPVQLPLWFAGAVLRGELTWRVGMVCQLGSGCQGQAGRGQHWIVLNVRGLGVGVPGTVQPA